LDLEIHITHAAACVLLRHFGHHGFGGDQESRDGRRVLDRYANYLGRIDDIRLTEPAPMSLTRSRNDWAC